MTYVNRVLDKQVIDSIKSFKKQFLRESLEGDSVWYFTLNVDNVISNGLIPFPHSGTDEFYLLDDKELSKKIELFKNEGGEKIYISTLRELRDPKLEDLYFEMACTVDAFNEYCMRIDDFRYEGWLILIPSNFKFFLIQEWDMDLLVAGQPFSRKYFDNQERGIVEEFKKRFQPAIYDKRKLLIDSLNLFDKSYRESR